MIDFTSKACALTFLLFIFGCSSISSKKAEYNDYCQQFRNLTENETVWAIRYGAEPIDFHIFGRNTSVDIFIENKLGITAGLGAFSNHLYIEIGNVEKNGFFSTLKRLHGFSLSENKQGDIIKAKSSKGRAFFMVVDGKYTSFSNDPIYIDDPHLTHQNQLQHANHKFLFGENATKIVFRGSEYHVLQLYVAMLVATIELNNQDLSYSALGIHHPNGNSYIFEMKEKLKQMANHLNIKICDHNPSGWDIGKKFMLETDKSKPLLALTSITELKKYVELLEIKSSLQLETIYKKGIKHDLNFDIPTP